jgi:hypothetical protein
MKNYHVLCKIIVVPFLLFFLILTSCNEMNHPTDSEALQSFSASQSNATTGIGQKRLDKPSKEWCEDAGYKNYGQCVKAWAQKGEILFVEHFEDTDFASRGWYDVRAGAVLTTDNPAPGTDQVLECTYEEGGQRCADGYPLRVEIEETESVYLSYWVRYSDNWVGSQRPYHPHEFHFTTNKDTQWVGPANSHLTMYIEQVDLIPMIALQDSRNVDNSCILLNNDNFVGCGGDFDTYPFTEARSVASCNGLDGFVDARDCFNTGSYWYSARKWSATSGPAFTPGEWHFVEALLNMNDIVDGKGVPNGSIRYWVDGEIQISSDEILFRTSENSDMAFKYLLFAPWIGDGSPITQTMWIGEITVATNVQ